MRRMTLDCTPKKENTRFTECFWSIKIYQKCLYVVDKCKENPVFFTYQMERVKILHIFLHVPIGWVDFIYNGRRGDVKCIYQQIKQSYVEVEILPSQFDFLDISRFLQLGQVGSCRRPRYL